MIKKMFKQFEILSENYVNFGVGLQIKKYGLYFKELNTKRENDIFL
ncbi:hypothetical protein [Candidatus Borreliella tachyglossi]